MICNKCGQSHEHQRVDYPLHTVITFEDGFAKQYGYETGIVVGHCDDGRASVELAPGKIHTFHYVDYFKSAQLPVESADYFPKGSGELESLRFRLKEANELVEPLTYENDRLKAQIADLTGALANAQEVASEQSRLRAIAEGELAEATILLEHSDKRITELEDIAYRQAELLDEKGYTQQEAMLRFQQKRITELERQLVATLPAIEAAANDGRLYAEGCAP